MTEPDIGITIVPSNVKKMEFALKKMEDLIHTQKTALQNMEREFRNFKRFAATFIENSKKKLEKKPRKPSGFVLPVPVSPELCRFLQLPEGSRISRTEVTKFLIHYIKENKLTGPDNKTRVVPDAALKELLGPDVDLNTLTRFTIQKYMTRHFYSGPTYKDPK
jgi:chromatin remodeling complex protein RSC6